MTDYDTYPALMWMLTTAILALSLTAALIPLIAALTPETQNGANS